jgi:uncharacterized protein YrrD
MHRVSELLGKPIISAESGERVGKVADVLLDGESRNVLGLVVGGGLLAAEQVLPFEHVQTLGVDTVVVRNASGLIGRKEWRTQATPAIRFADLRGRPVFTSKGRGLGAIRDVHLTDGSSRIEGFEVGGGPSAGVVRMNSVDLIQDDVAIGPDAVIVAEATVVAPITGHQR